MPILFDKEILGLKRSFENDNNANALSIHNMA